MYLDIAIIVIFALCVIFGIKRGLVRSALRFIGSVAAACLSTFFGTMAAQWIFTNLFRPAIVQRVNQSLTAADDATQVTNILDTFPDFFLRILEKNGVTKTSLNNQIAANINSAAETVATAVAPAIISLLKMMAVIVIFMLLMVVVRMVVNMAAGVFKLPILHEINSLLGGVFSFLTALVFVWAAFALVQLLLPMTPADWQNEFQRLVQTSVIAKLFLQFNPLGMMFSA